MLIENTLFGIKNKVEIAIERFKTFEEKALSMSEDGYYLAFSGGKDSIVIHDLALKSGVKFKAHFNVTTVDAPEVLRFIKTNYPAAKWHYPKLSMWLLIPKNLIPPTRLARYCCEYLKEGNGQGVIITGVRWKESLKRSKRKMFEACFKDKRKFYLNPIIDWTEKDVWEYIKGNGLKYPSLYDEGFKRIGCIGCPMAGKNREKEFIRWPHFKKMYLKAFDRCVQERKNKGKTIMDKYATKWSSGQAMFDWWMEEKHENNDQQCFMLE